MQEVESWVFVDEATHEAAQRIASKMDASVAYLVREAVLFGGVNPLVQLDKLPRSRPVKVKFRWSAERREAVRQMAFKQSVSASAWISRAVARFVADLDSPRAPGSAARLTRYFEVTNEMLDLAQAHAAQV